MIPEFISLADFVACSILGGYSVFCAWWYSQL